MRSPFYKIAFLTIIMVIPFVLPLRAQKDSTTNDTIKAPKKDTTQKEMKVSENSEETTAKTQKNNTDTVYLFDDENMYINVMKITYDSIIYREPGSSTLKRLDKNKVNKIRYTWGKLEILNETKPKIQERFNWRKVKVLKNKKATENLIKVEEIEAKIEGSNRGYDSPKSLESRAKVVLRKKAANINAKYVLITSKNVNIAFGELPSATFKGIAYTDEKKPTTSAKSE